MASIDGPRIPPLSGKARQLVVFLHGFGADGNDLIELGREWQQWLPDAAFVAPHAPDPCQGAPMGRQWFPLTFRDPSEVWRGVNQAAPGLDAFLDAELARHGIPAGGLALVGFSQGSMMALHVGLRRAAPPAAVTAYSGLLPLEPGRGAESLTPSVRAKPPILLVHGDRDDVLPVEMFFFSKEALAGAGVSCQWHLAVGASHGIDGASLRHGGLFLAQSFGLPTPG